jgi:hypothetical protein
VMKAMKVAGAKELSYLTLFNKQKQEEC